MRLTSLTSSFFLMAEIFVKLGEQICAWCEGSLDTGVLALKLLLGALRAELRPCCLTSSLAWAGVSSSTRALTLVLAWPLGGGWNKTNERRSLHHCNARHVYLPWVGIRGWSWLYLVKIRQIGTQEEIYCVTICKYRHIMTLVWIESCWMMGGMRAIQFVDRYPVSSSRVITGSQVSTWRGESVIAVSVIYL